MLLININKIICLCDLNLVRGKFDQLPKIYEFKKLRHSL